MSGHSKWSQIKRQKAITDLKKGQIFSKFANAISVAAKEGGGSPETNFKLRLVIERAKAAGMPNDNIDRAIKRGTGEDKEGVSITQVLYEGFGPAGSVFIVEGATDNTNRTLGEIKQIFNKNNGQMANSGSVLWMFDQRGLILVRTSEKDRVTLAAIDAGATDVSDREEGLEIYTETKDLMKVKDVVEKTGAEIVETQLAWVAKQTIDPSASERAKIIKLSEALEFADDIVAVHDNLF